MSHKEVLLNVYKDSASIEDVRFPKDISLYLDLITSRIERNKWLYTVLITLFIHKSIFPEQDIRLFQSKFNWGFSARTIDTKSITPTLRNLWLPSMSESWWLTRSLEQPYPYDLKYKWEISGKWIKKAFLMIIDYVQNNPSESIPISRAILNKAIDVRERNKVEIKKIDTDDTILISNIIGILIKHFTFKYGISGWSKLPVIAFYAIYELLIPELKRYQNSELLPLWNHTTSDETSKSAWDIEISKNHKIIEAIEVKFDKEIDINVLKIAYQKIAKFGVKRYYILSYIWTKEEDKIEIEKLIADIKYEHWCQVIVNWVIDTLKYYLRLIETPQSFLNNYIALVEKDTELKIIHKTKLKELLS